MLDRKLLRESPDTIKQRLALRGAEFPSLVDAFLKEDELRRSLQARIDELKAGRNKLSKEIGSLLKSGDPAAAEELKRKAKELGEEVAALERDFASASEALVDSALAMPNLTHDTVPAGEEGAGEVVKTGGEPVHFDFKPQDHLQLCAALNLVNFEAGSRLAGSGFPVMHGPGALLQRGLLNLMLDIHVNRHGYTELRPPFMVQPHCAVGTGNLPKFGDEMYHVNVSGGQAPAGDPGQPGYFLIPTAEMPLCNYYRDTILESPRLPVKLCAYSPCWRVEAGSYGKEARGLTRVHQFEKVELVRVADPERSWDDLEELTAEAEYILELLGLAYRRVVLPTGDMAFASAKTYDLEVHCPAEDKWREVSSASNTTDYQSRRANVRFRRESGAKPEYPHLLNASGLALPRLVIALIETYQTAQGTVRLPEALKPYLPGTEELAPPTGGVPFV